MRAAFVLALACCAGAVCAQPAAWPAKPVRIVPFAPGGTADMLGRLIAKKLGEASSRRSWWRTGPAPAARSAPSSSAKAAPDGYTLLVSGVASHVLAPALPRGVPYDPLRDFTHIALFGGPPSVLVVNPAVPAKDLQEFVALVKGKAQEVFLRLAGQRHARASWSRSSSSSSPDVEMQHVPYKGAAGAVSRPHRRPHPGRVDHARPRRGADPCRAGERRSPISAAARLPDYPDVPTFAEAGYQELVATIWFSLSAPARPAGAEIVERLNAEVRKALDSPEVRERLSPRASSPAGSTRAQFTAFVAEELKRWTPVVRASSAGATDGLAGC